MGLKKLRRKEGTYLEHLVDLLARLLLRDDRGCLPPENGAYNPSTIRQVNHAERELEEGKTHLYSSASCSSSSTSRSLLALRSAASGIHSRSSSVNPGCLNRRTKNRSAPISSNFSLNSSCFLILCTSNAINLSSNAALRMANSSYVLSIESPSCARNARNFSVRVTRDFWPVLNVGKRENRRVCVSGGSVLWVGRGEMVRTEARLLPPLRASAHLGQHRLRTVKKVAPQIT